LPTKLEHVLVDTSVAVAAMLATHDAHPSAHAALTGTRPGLAGHAWFEAFSVLTRLPPPQRGSPADIARALTANFPGTRWLPETAAAELAGRCASLGIAGGAIYDALVAATAIAHSLPLLSRDRRAISTYTALGAEIRVLS
jgi:predicted nucleic acid-binding protein